MDSHASSLPEIVYVVLHNISGAHRRTFQTQITRVSGMNDLPALVRAASTTYTFVDPSMTVHQIDMFAAKLWHLPPQSTIHVLLQASSTRLIRLDTSDELLRLVPYDPYGNTFNADGADGVSSIADDNDNYARAAINDGDGDA